MNVYPTNLSDSNEPLPRFTYDPTKEAGLQSLPEIEVFKHVDFNFQTDVCKIQLEDKQRHIAEDTGLAHKTSLRTTFDVDLAATGHSLNNNISSIIIYSGYWQFLSNDGSIVIHILGPGHYPSVGEFGIKNDTIASFKSVKP